MTIKNISIKSLVLLENNPRTISKHQFAKLCKSIQDDPDFLNKRPVLVNCVDGVNHVYAGNQRVRAAKKLKMKDIACIIDNDLDENLLQKRIIQDNKTYGEFDFDLLANHFDAEMLVDCGFTLDELQMGDIQDLGSTDEEEGNQLSPPSDPKTKPGDLYELGSHRLKCGDSTLPDDVHHLLGDAIPILMVTDPPYGVEYDPSWRENIKEKKGIGAKAVGKVKNDDKINWSLAWHLFPGSIAYIWCASWFLPHTAKALDDSDFERKSLIIWKKQHFALSRGDYHWHHEPCWYAIKKGHQHNWQGSRKESTIWEIDNLNAFGGSKEEGEERTCHSTQKPMECMAKPIRNNSAEGEGVYDPFLGSGTTLMACEKLNRICYGMEIDPAYCDVIVNRWCKATGKKAKINGVEIEEL